MIMKKSDTRLVLMNVSKAVLATLVIVLCVISLSSCKKCKGEDPRARITNNGTMVASVQIKTSNGNTENINNVAPGTTSEFKSYAAGTVMFTITVDKVTSVETVALTQCYEYNIAIDAANKITTTPTDRN